MSLNVHFLGLKPVDEHWRRMKAAYDACSKAGVLVPTAVTDFFEGMPPPNDEAILEDLDRSVAVERIDYEDGMAYDVRLADLPKDIQILRILLR